MKTLRHRIKPLHLIAAIFFSVLMAGNPIASSYGLAPTHDIIRSFRARSVRTIRNLLIP